MSSQVARIVGCSVFLALLACAPRAHSGVQGVAPALTAPSPRAADNSASDELASRSSGATATRAAIERAIQFEDGPRKGKAKSLKVGDQVRAELERAAKLVPASPYTEPSVREYEEACVKLEVAYLASLLESTDSASQVGSWRPDERRDVLGSPSADAKLAAWQARDPGRSFVKFAVVRASGGQSLEVRVGPLDVGHVDIAGEHALSAGLLRTAVSNGKTYVVAFENTSGGFRPGPLRNRTTFAAIKAAGYSPTSSSGLTIYDNPSGGYADSKLMVPPP